MGKFTSQGTSYGGTSFGARMGDAFGGGISSGFTDQRTTMRDEKKQLMQNLGNNGQLAAANEGDPGAFRYGGRYLKIIDKPKTGTDVLNAEKAKFYAMDQMMAARTDSMIKSFAARLDYGQATQIADDAVKAAAAAYGLDPTPFLGTYKPPEKKEEKPGLAGRAFKAIGNFFTETEDEVPARKITKEDMKTKPVVTQSPTQTTAPAQFNMTATPTPVYTPPSGRDVSEAIKSIQAVAPQPKDVPLEDLVKRIREEVAKGTSKEMIIRALDWVVDPEAVYNEAIK